MKAYYGATFLKWNGAFFISSRRALTASTSRATLPLLRQHREGVLQEGVILKYMFECNLISLCSANTTSLVANNNTRWIVNIINRYGNHSSENSVEKRGRENHLGVLTWARNRMWLDVKYTSRDLPSCFLCIFVSCQMHSHYALAELSQKRFLARPVLFFWLTLYHPKWFS